MLSMLNARRQLLLGMWRMRRGLEGRSIIANRGDRRSMPWHRCRCSPRYDTSLLQTPHTVLHQIDLQVQVIACVRALLHPVLLHQHEGAEQHAYSMPRSS